MSARAEAADWNLGQRVRSVRRHAEVSQADLARWMVAAGHPFRQSTVSKIELGSRPVLAREIHDLAVLLGVSTGWLLTGKDE